MGGHAVTAVVVNFNSGDLLARCLDGLQEHHPAHVVVVDNASSDDSWRAAERAGVVLVRSPENVGFAPAVNRALDDAPDAFVLLLNADVDLEPGYVDALARELTGDDTVAGATGVLLLADDEVDSTGIELTSARWAADRGRGTRVADAPIGEPFGVSGAAALFRRAALAEGMWEPLFVYWEDVELAWRLRRGGWRFATVPEARAFHARGSDTAEGDFVEAANFAGRLATIARHEGARGLLRPSALAASVVVVARLVVRHPRVLRRAHPLAAVRVGLHARRADRALGLPVLPRGAFSPHPWRSWLAAQLTGQRRGYGARQVRPSQREARTIDSRREDRH